MILDLPHLGETARAKTPGAARQTPQHSSTPIWANKQAGFARQRQKNG